MFQTNIIKNVGITIVDRPTPTLTKLKDTLFYTINPCHTLFSGTYPCRQHKGVPPLGSITRLWLLLRDRRFLEEKANFERAKLRVYRTIR